MASDTPFDILKYGHGASKKGLSRGRDPGYDGRSDRHWYDLIGMGEDEAKAKIEEEIQKEVAEAEREKDREATQTLSFNVQEVRDAAKIDLDFLAGLAMPEVIEYPFPPVLLAAWDLLRQYLEKLFTSPKLALGIPRGHGKTTFIKLFILYCILFTRIRFPLIISSTEGHSINILADVEDILNEPNIIGTFGDWKSGLETNQLALKKFGFMGRNIVIAGIGQGGSLRGLNLKNERPDLMIFDDIQTKECSESITMSAALERWMIGTAMKARSPRGCIYVFLGNMYPGENSILRKLRNNAQWIKFVSGAILADGTALWPQLRSVESLIEEFDNDIAMGHPEIFLSEVQNDTEVGINTNTDLGNIKDWPWGEHEVPQGKFIIIDPSSNKNKGDSTVIALFEVYDTIPGMKAVIEERLSPGNVILKALLMALDNKVRLIAVESTAFQYTLLYWFEKIAKEVGVQGIQFVPVYTGSYSKNSRINDTLKTLTQAGMYLHPNVKNRVLHQIVNWNPMKRDNVDDLLDALSYAPRVIELYNSEIASEIEMVARESDGGRAKVWEMNSPF